jgi:hypothetical protein
MKRKFLGLFGSLAAAFAGQQAQGAIEDAVAQTGTVPAEEKLAQMLVDNAR